MERQGHRETSHLQRLTLAQARQMDRRPQLPACSTGLRLAVRRERLEQLALPARPRALGVRSTRQSGSDSRDRTANPLLPPRPRGLPVRARTQEEPLGPTPTVERLVGRFRHE